MGIRIAAIYNVWIDSIELLRGSIDCIKNHVDEIIIVYQNTSNFGEEADTLTPLLEAIKGIEVQLFCFKPYANQPGGFNERAKRNIGLDIARKSQATHFLMLDSDEYYFDFANCKKLYIDSGHNGSVVGLYTYFKKPTWRVEIPEKYFVPFIHKLRNDTVAGKSNYPYYVDPTRKINETDVCQLSFKMHHFSYVRKDIHIKVRNSSARANIEKSQLVYDWENAKSGMFVKDFDSKLIEVPNIFNIEV